MTLGSGGTRTGGWARKPGPRVHWKQPCSFLSILQKSRGVRVRGYLLGVQQMARGRAGQLAFSPGGQLSICPLMFALQAALTLHKARVVGATPCQQAS